MEEQQEQQAQQELKALMEELDALVDDGNHSRALELVGSVLQSVGTSELRPQLLARRAGIRLDLDDGEGALEDGREAIARGLATAEVFGVCGWASFHLDKLEKARQYFDRGLKLDGGDSSLLMGRALVLADLDELDLAVADLSRALEEDPDDYHLRGIRGEIFLRMGALKQAKKDLNAAFEADPDDVDVAMNLARYRLLADEADEALAVLADVDGDDLGLEGLLLRSHVRLQTSDVSGARSDAIRASNLFPDEAFAFVQLATVELARGNQTLASKAAERAVLLDPSLSDAYAARATARQLDGDVDGAKEDLERARRAPPELPLFLMGPAATATPPLGAAFDPSNFAEQFGSFFGAGPEGFDPSEAFGKGFEGFGQGPLPGMNPLGMLDQIFDSSGNIRGPLKPIFEMALKNAPKIMETLPPELLGDFDKGELKELDLSDLSPEDMEERMREVYQMLKSGPPESGPPEPGDEGDDE